MLERILRVSQHADHEKRSRIAPAAFVASMALVAQALCACSGLPSSTSASGPYPNLNEPPPSRESVDQAARAKADLTATRDDAERAAAQQQAFQ